MSGNNGSRLQLPNQMEVQLQAHPGPHAVPITQAIPLPGRIEVHTFGGMTVLQASAMQIAAGLAANPHLAGQEPEKLAALAVEMAIAVGTSLDNRGKTEQEQSHE